MTVRLMQLTDDDTTGSWRPWLGYLNIIPVTRTPFIIGRGPACHCRLPTPTVRPYHCVVFLSMRDGKVFVRSQSSATGTPGNRPVETREVRHGDWVKIGPYVFEVGIDSDWPNAIDRLDVGETTNDLPGELLEDAAAFELLSWDGDYSEEVANSFGPEDLDLDLFKRSLGFALPVAFNAEGGLCNPWVAEVNGWGFINEPRPRFHAPQSVPREATERQPSRWRFRWRLGWRVQARSWEAETRQCQADEVLTAAVSLLVYCLLAFCAYFFSWSGWTTAVAVLIYCVARFCWWLAQQCVEVIPVSQAPNG
jgi:hypothetical protein